VQGERRRKRRRSYFPQAEAAGASWGCATIAAPKEQDLGRVSTVDLTVNEKKGIFARLKKTQHMKSILSSFLGKLYLLEKTFLDEEFFIKNSFTVNSICAK